MAKDVINVQYPVTDDTQSVGVKKITKAAVDPSKGISIANAFANKNNTLLICVENTDDENSSVTFLAGDAYPNAMLGDLSQAVTAESVTAFQIQDISRFENKDGSLNIDFADGFTGNIFVVAKSVALNV